MEHEIERRARVWRNALLAEALKARAGEDLAEEIKTWLQGARYWSPEELVAHLVEIQCALAAFATRRHLIQRDPYLYSDFPDILEGLRPAAERRIKDDRADAALGLETPFPDAGETTVYVPAGVMRAVARLLGIDTQGVQAVPSEEEATPCQPPPPSPPSSTPPSTTSTEPT